MTDNEWNIQRKQRILEQQRERRKTNRRIDYYPSKEALEAIETRLHNYAGGDYSGVDLLPKLVRNGHRVCG